MLNTIRNEPLVLFIIVAGLFFCADHIAERNHKMQLDISPQTLRAIVEQEQNLKGSDLTPEEQDAAVQRYIDEKILLDEAYRLGLNQDRTIDQRLLRKIRAVSTVSIAEPTQTILKQYYEENPLQFSEPSRWDLDIIVLTDHETTSDDIITELDKALPYTTMARASRLTYINRQEAAFQLGEHESRKLEVKALNQWNGPIQRNDKIIAYRIVRYQPEKLRPYAEVERYVYNAWLMREQDKVMTEKLAELKNKYVIFKPAAKADSDKASGSVTDFVAQGGL